MPQTPPIRYSLLAAALAATLALAGCSNQNNAVAYSQYKSKQAAYSQPSAYRFKILEADVINVSSCTRGLNSGELATARAGQAALKADSLPVFNPARRAESDFKTPSPRSSSASIKVRGGLTDKLLVAAYGLTGRPYRGEGRDPQSGFNAPGFTHWVFDRTGVSIPADVNRQAAGGKSVAKEDLRPGDLLVYRLPQGYHVGIYSGQGNFLHASPQTRAVTETAAFGPEFSPYFQGGRRYFDDPKAAPLSDEQKMAATSSAVKVALSELPSGAKPEKVTYSRPNKSSSKSSAKAKSSRSSRSSRSRR